MYQQPWPCRRHCMRRTGRHASVKTTLRLAHVGASPHRCCQHCVDAGGCSSSGCKPGFVSFFATNLCGTSCVLQAARCWFLSRSWRSHPHCSRNWVEVIFPLSHHRGWISAGAAFPSDQLFREARALGIPLRVATLRPGSWPASASGAGHIFLHTLGVRHHLNAFIIHILQQCLTHACLVAQHAASRQFNFLSFFTRRQPCRTVAADM